MLYNDRSVQENHHISAAFGVLNRVSLILFSYCISKSLSISQIFVFSFQQEINILGNLSSAEYR